MMEIFPYVLLRIGGGPFDNLELINIKSDYEFEEEYRRKHLLRDEVSNLLYKDISSLTDSKDQNALLKIKRDLYNERNIEISKLDGLGEIIGSETAKAIESYIKSIDNVNKYSEELKRKFDQAIPQIREKLKKLSQDINIQNGFVFSSHSLYNNIREYISHTGEYTKNNKRTEISIIKYLTRSYAKTSPFSSFNNLGMGIISDINDDKFITKSNEKEYKIKSNIRINNSIFAYIRNCIFKIRELYVHLNITANPTITTEGNDYRYLINFNNIESFQNIGKTPIVEYFLSIIRESGRMKYYDFINKVISDEMLDATEKEIDEYIYKLIELGFFEFDINISGLDTNWLDKLTGFLSRLEIKSETRDLIVSTLFYLNSLIPFFENASISERIDLTIKGCDKFTEMKLHLDKLLKPPEETSDKEDENLTVKDKPKEPKDSKAKDSEEKAEEQKKVIKNVQYYYFDLKPETVFYEDTIVEGEFKINYSITNKIIKDFYELFNFFGLFELYKDEQDKMSHFFKKKYPDANSVSLLTFYKEYISIKKAEKERKEKEEKARKEKAKDEINKGISDEEVIPEIKQRYDIQKIFFEKIIKVLSGQNYTVNDDIDLSPEIFESAIEKDEMYMLKAGRFSAGLFIQFFNEETENGESLTKAVINASFPGYGKMTSRFLHLFPAEFTDETRKWNSGLDEKTLLAENIDSGIMNFNLHPALMPYEISIPGGNFALDFDRRIYISDLIIIYDKESNGLRLYDTKRDEFVYAFDLGFQGPGGRSELFKFLINFTFPGLAFLYPFYTRILEMLKPVDVTYNGIKDKIKIHPRITYKKNIIVSRREWIIPKSLLPYKNSAETESEYFVRIQKWRFELGIPEEIFLSFNSKIIKENESNKPKKKLSRDDRKPQYINFSNPFLVRLFEKHLDKVIDSIKVTEMMPESKKMLKINGKKYVTEFVVQSYKN